MYIEIQKNKNSEYIFLRKSTRDKKTGKIVKKTLANLTHEPYEQIVAIKNALKNKQQIDTDDLEQGKTIGFSLVIVFIMKMLFITKTIGKTFEAKIALMLIVARVFLQGSRLQALFWSKERDHILDILNFTKLEKEKLNDKTIYDGLDYLFENQTKIEDTLFRYNYQTNKPKRLYYDVTSTYVEGEYARSSLVEYGYNRDGKKGKKQIVIGLLSDQDGRALSIDVYPGSTNDIKTFKTQLQKAKERFGLEKITFVGDGGMIKSEDIERLREFGYDYITTIPKSTIKSMCQNEQSKMECSLFDEKLNEFVENDTRYILRLNPIRRDEIRKNRDEKIKRLREYIDKQKEYYNTHYRSKKETIERNITNFIDKLHLDSFIKPSFTYEFKQMELVNTKTKQTALKTKELLEDVELVIDQKAKEEIEKLDGCYAIKTSITDTQTAKEIHAAYKELIKVENAFKTLKTDFLHIRPLYLKTDKRIRGHIFLSMIAYNIVYEIKRFTKKADLDFFSTMEDLRSVVSVRVRMKKDFYITYIPKVNGRLEKLFSVMDFCLPKRVDY